jgi:hypothetical protein
MSAAIAVADCGSTTSFEKSWGAVAAGGDSCAQAAARKNAAQANIFLKGGPPDGLASTSPLRLRVEPALPRTRPSIEIAKILTVAASLIEHAVPQGFRCEVVHAAGCFVHGFHDAKRTPINPRKPLGLMVNRQNLPET